MHEYSARLIQILDGGSLELDINLGLNYIHLYKKVYLNRIIVPKIDDKLEKDKGLAAKQRLSDLLSKAEDGVFRIKTEEIKDELFVTIYIGGMNVNKTLVNEGLASGKGF